jgi:ArsR family transcriptional regulator
MASTRPARASNGDRAAAPVGDIPNAGQLEAEALAFKALGHPTRLLMVRALAGGELCVCDLQRLTGIDMSTVSRHLLQLKTAGVLASRRRGNQVLYRLRTPCVVTVMDCVAGVTDSDPATSSAATGDDDRACSRCGADRHVGERLAPGRSTDGSRTTEQSPGGRT